MESSYLAGNIDFLFSFKLAGEEHIVYQATLKNENEGFRIHISPDELNSFNEINYRCRRWKDEIPSFNFGEYLQPKNAHIEGKEVSLDLTKTHLITIKLEVNSSQTVFYFIIDNYQYSYAHSNTECKAIFFLNNPSNQLVRGLSLVDSDFEKSTIIPKTHQLSTPNFNCQLTANLEKDAYTAIIEYAKYHDLEEIIKENELFLDIVSFYYASPIEVYLTVIENPNNIIVKYQQPHYNLQEKFYNNMNLAYLNLNLKKRKLTCFLDAITVDTNSSNVYHVIISDYIRSQLLDETSEFIVLYSILETLAGQRDDENFSDSENMRKCFEELYEPFATKINLSEEEKHMPPDPQKPNGEKQETIRWKWDRLKDILIKKPMSNSVKQLLENLDIDWDKINEEIVSASIKKIKHITTLRNKLVHNRDNDYTHKLPMKSINSKMSFAVCIVLLNKLGITNIEFHQDYPLLSIFKKK